ncbi:MAG: glycosyltransferase family 2 protein [Parasporobacterium sp.]|nr:glycosyltransferase family 2 protein [Parasporobacterium sp.]
MNSVLAIVVTYNRLEMLKECVEHLRNQTFPCDILIVDNASTDGTRVWAAGLNSKETRQLIKGNPSPVLPEEDTVAVTATMLWDEDSMHHVIYENTGSNLGGAGGFNYGMRRAVEMGYTYAWVMDDDAFADPDCLEKLMKAASSLGEFGFLTSAVLWKDGTLCRMNWQRKYPTPAKRSERHLLMSDLSRDLVQIQSSTFVSALFPVSVICRVGLPISDFFIWCDDIEFTRRIALKHGLPAYVVTDSRITHYIKNNEGTNLAKDDPERIDRYNYAFRNENYMYRQYGLKGFGYYLVVIAYNTFKVLTAARSCRLKRLKVIYKNLFTGLAFNPRIEYPRKITQL